jgi:hypothetical protein
MRTHVERGKFEYTQSAKHAVVTNYDTTAHIWALSSSVLRFLDHAIRHTVALLWTSDQPVAEASTYTGQHNI